MSVSSLLVDENNHWKNLYINNLTVDGSISGDGISGTFNASFTGAIGPVTVPCYWTKFKNCVTISFGRIAGNYVSGTDIVAAAGTIPAVIRPPDDENFFVGVTNSPSGSIGSNNPGRLTIFSNGSIAFQRDFEGSSWGDPPTTVVSGSLNAFSITYIIRS